MEKETLSPTFKNSLQSSKDFVAKKYHNLADFVTKTFTAHKEKGRNRILKITFAKYALVFMDILYLITSLIMISIGVLGRIVFVNFRLTYQFDLLPILWIAIGTILLFVSLFGLIGAFRESTVWTNIFGILMTIVFVAQISTAIYTFQFIGHSKGIASSSIKKLMIAQAHANSYRDKNVPWEMDWIQRHYQCCGNSGPSDWDKYSPYQRWIYTYDDRYDIETEFPSTFSTHLPNRMPSSCCRDLSNYNDLTCESYYEDGCFSDVREMISVIVMIVGSVALSIAVFEILGIALAFPAARILQKTKSTVTMQLNDTLGNSTANRDEIMKAGGNVETI